MNFVQKWTNQCNLEIIAQYIIEKCISYTIYEINKSSYQFKINDHCFETFTKKLLNLTAFPRYITYDKDEFCKSKEEDFKYFFNNIYYGENTWTGIDEPVLLIQ